MKKTILPLALLSISLLSPSLFAYEPPSDDDLAQMLANPSLIKTVLADADGEQAAVLMLRVIESLEAADLGPKQIEYLIAYYTARIAFMLPATEATEFATSLINRAPAAYVPTIFAGLSIGSAGNTELTAQLKELAGEDPTFLRAINTPNIQLTDPVFTVLVSALGAAQTLPPAPTDSLPPPPGIEGGQSGGGETPPPVVPPVPPVPPTYDGQG
jgi:hypothetical protein